MAWCNKETRHCLSHSYQPIMTCNIPMVQWVNQLKRRQYEQKDLANKNKFDRENPSLLSKIIVNPSCHLSDLVQSWYLVVSFLQMNQKRCPICCLYGVHSLKEVLSFLPFILCSISCHYDDVIMTMLASQITSLTVVYSIVYSGVNQRKHQSSASLAFVREIHRGPVNFPHKWPVTRKMFPFDDVIMSYSTVIYWDWYKPQLSLRMDVKIWMTYDKCWKLIPVDTLWESILS